MNRGINHLKVYFYLGFTLGFSNMSILKRWLIVIWGLLIKIVREGEILKVLLYYNTFFFWSDSRVEDKCPRIFFIRPSFFYTTVKDKALKPLTLFMFKTVIYIPLYRLRDISFSS